MHVTFHYIALHCIQFPSMKSKCLKYSWTALRLKTRPSNTMPTNMLYVSMHMHSAGALKIHVNEPFGNHGYPLLTHTIDVVPSQHEGWTRWLVRKVLVPTSGQDPCSGVGKLRKGEKHRQGTPTMIPDSSLSKEFMLDVWSHMMSWFMMDARSGTFTRCLEPLVHT